MTDQLLVACTVEGRPASYSTAATAPWKAAIRERLTFLGIQPLKEGRFRVRIVFRTAKAKTANEAWDIDNLIKPTLDAMEAVFGLRRKQGKPEAADDRVDQIEATKRTVRENESPGADITVWLVADG